jgi:hypothetical protein
MAMFVPLILGLATALQGGQGKEYNPVNILTQKLIKSPKEVGQSMADRIADYIVNGDDKGFISPESRSKDCVLAQIRSTPASWVADEVKQNKAVEVAQLYFVLGADKQARFSERMNPWTQASPDEKGVGWYSRGDARTWVKKFLGASRGDASYAASAVWISSAILNEATVRKELGEVARNLQGRAEAEPWLRPGMQQAVSR